MEVFRMKIEYGISFISIFNFFKNISQVMDDFLKIGYNVFQSLPLNKVSGNEKKVVYFEDVWRPDLQNIFQLQKGRVFDDLLSFYLFRQGNKRTEILKLYEWKKVKKIKHRWDENGNYIEISNMMNAKNLKHIENVAISREISLIPDIKHLKEFMQIYNVTIEEIVGQLGYLFAPIIHFQPLCKIKKFIKRKNFDDSEEFYIFSVVLSAILKNFQNKKYKAKNITIIVEYNPAFLIFSKKKSLETAKKMIEIIKKYL